MLGMPKEAFDAEAERMITLFEVQQNNQLLPSQVRMLPQFKRLKNSGTTTPRLMVVVLQFERGSMEPYSRWTAKKLAREMAQ